MKRFAFLLLVGLSFTAPTRAAAKPNILIFETDDQRSNTMAMMPTAQRLFIRGGTEFKHSFVTTPVCCPSRASMFSGQYAHNTGITGNTGTPFNRDNTWEHYLHSAGYYTGIVGKYLNYHPIVYAKYFDYRDNPSSYFQGQPEIGAFDRSVRAFLRHAEQHDSRPWALIVATYSPHNPWDVQPTNPIPIPPYSPRPSYQEADLSDKGPAVRAANEPWPPDAIYNGQMMETQAADEELGNVFAAMGRRGETSNTLALFTSDNGFMWGEHDLEFKGWPYRESIKVPLYARWPGHVAAGAVDHRLVANIDIAPTIFDAAGVKPGYTVDGHSLLGSYSRPWLLIEWPSEAVHDIPPWWSYVDAKRQYINWSDGWHEYYDNATDPWQMKASNGDRPKLDQRIAAASTCEGTSCP